MSRVDPVSVVPFSLGLSPFFGVKDTEVRSSCKIVPTETLHHLMEPPRLKEQ